MKLQADHRCVHYFSCLSKTGFIAELKNVCAFLMGADCLSGRPLFWRPLLRAEALADGTHLLAGWGHGRTS